MSTTLWSSQFYPVQDPPQQGNEEFMTDEDTGLEDLNLIANNADPDGDILSVNTPFGVVGTGGGVFTNNGDGTVDYEPAMNYFGNDTLFYEVCDTAPVPNCVNDTVVIIVAPINDPPTQGNEEAITQVDEALPGIDLDDNNIDVEGGDITLTFPDGLTGTNGGTFTDNMDGTVDYTPATGYIGNDTLFYTACDDFMPPACVQDTLVIIILDCDIDDPMSDCDRDGVTNGQEVADGTNPSDPCELDATNQTLLPSASWLAGDCDNDGVPNGVEVSQSTDPTDPCEFTSASITLPVTSMGDCDGDGVSNADEVNGPDGDPATPDGTEYDNDCSFVVTEITLTVTSISDCDGDGVTNADEATDNTRSIRTM